MNTPTKVLKHRESCKKYYHNNREKLLKYHDKYRNEHRNELNQWYRDYYQQNKEKIKAQRKIKKLEYVCTELNKIKELKS